MYGIGIRNACEALIVRDGQALLNKNLNTVGKYGVRIAGPGSLLRSTRRKSKSSGSQGCIRKFNRVKNSARCITHTRTKCISFSCAS